MNSIIEMGTVQSKLPDQCEKRLREVEYININILSLEELKELCHELEIEMSELGSKKASKLPEETRDILKRRYLKIIQWYKDTVRDTDSLNELTDELTNLKRYLKLLSACAYLTERMRLSY